MDHGPYPWVTQDASAAPPRAPPQPAPAGGMLSNPFAAPPRLRMQARARHARCRTPTRPWTRSTPCRGRCAAAAA